MYSVAVSYTHLANIYLSDLDNYMQEYNEKYDCEPERRRTTREYERASRRYRKARKALMGAEKSTPEPVSYTHLDVYKRQIQSSRLTVYC